MAAAQTQDATADVGAQGDAGLARRDQRGRRRGQGGPQPSCLGRHVGQGQWGDVAPVGQAVLALREKVIAGQAPGIKKQSELFTDPIGHVNHQIKVLETYCHYAVIYRRNPVGLPVPKILAAQPEAEALNKLLQELAWNAVKSHPLSGVN